MTKTFTIVRRTTVGYLDAQGNKGETAVIEEFYHLPGRDAVSVCEDFISQLADEDERLADMTPDDEDYEFEHMLALDDVQGAFLVYEGTHMTRPASEPLHTEGEPGNPVYWIRRSFAA